MAWREPPGIPSPPSRVFPADSAGPSIALYVDPAALRALLHEAVDRGVEARIREAIRLKPHRAADVAAGRSFVAAYVTYIHYVEGLYEAAAPGREHGASHDAGSAHDHGAHGRRRVA